MSSDSSSSSPGSNSSGNRSPSSGDKSEDGGRRARPRKRPWRKPQWLMHWRRILLILLGVIGLVAALYFGYRQLKKRQISRLDQQAIAYLQQGKVKEAQMSLQTALRLNTADPVALRLLARLQETLGKEVGGLQAYQELARSGKMRIADLAPFAMLAERQGNAQLADRLAEAAAKSSPILGHLIRADLLKQRKQPAKAAEELRLAIKESEAPLVPPQVDSAKSTAAATASDKNSSKSPVMDPTVVAKMMTEMGDSARMGLIDLLLRNGGAIHPGDPAKATAESLLLLKVLANRNNNAAAQALATGLRAGVIPPAEQGAWIERLRSHPKATTEMLLLADVAAIQHDPTDKVVVASAMIERAKKQAPGQRLTVAQVLLQLNEPALVSNLISRDEAMKNPAAFLIWMQAKVRAANHGEVIKALELPANPLPPHLRDLYLAAELKSDHQDAKAETAFQKALADHVIHGKKGPEQAETLIFLSAAEEQSLVEQGLRALLAEPANAEATLNTVAAGVQRQRDSAKMLRIMELASATPTLAGNVRVANELAYLRLVMGKPVEMRDLVARREANPNEFAFRVTESLALVQAGKNAKALEVLESIEADVDASKLPPRQLAILAMAMALNGDKEKATHILSHVRPDMLSRQEVTLIQQKAPMAAPNPSTSLKSTALGGATDDTQKAPQGLQGPQALSPGPIQESNKGVPDSNVISPMAGSLSTNNARP